MAWVAGEERYSLMSKTGRPAAWRAVVWMVAVEQGFSERGDVRRGSSVVSLDARGEGGESLLAVWKLSWLPGRTRCWSRSPMVAGGNNGWVNNGLGGRWQAQMLRNWKYCNDGKQTGAMTF